MNNVVKLWNAGYGKEVLKRLDTFINKESFNDLASFTLLDGFSMI